MLQAESNKEEQKPSYLISPKTLKYMAFMVYLLDEVGHMQYFFSICGVGKELIEKINNPLYENIEKMLNDLSSSNNKKDHIALLRIAEALCSSFTEVRKYFDFDFGEHLDFEYIVKEALKVDGFTLNNNFKLIKAKRNYWDRNEDISDLKLYLKMKAFICEDEADHGFNIRRLSYKNNSLLHICRALKELSDEKLIYLELFDDFPAYGEQEIFNWEKVKYYQENPLKVEDDFHIRFLFVEERDEKLKLSLEEEVKKFKKKYSFENYPDDIKWDYFEDQAYIDDEMSGKLYTYDKQIDCVVSYIDYLYKKSGKNITFNFNDFKDTKVDLLRTLLFLWFEGYIDLKCLDNDRYDWHEAKDNIFTKLIPNMEKIRNHESGYFKKVETRGEQLPNGLSDTGLIFVQKSGDLICGNYRERIKPSTNQHIFCKIMFKKKSGQKVSWDIIYKSMTGIEIDRFDKKAWNIVYQTMTQVNKKIRKLSKADQDYFKLEKYEVIRQY